MKIDKITICNLASIEGEQTIDFTVEPLRSAGLFAITGDTGAGKSTVLDAICLALYDEAPRLNNVQKMEKTQTISAETDEKTPEPLQPDNTRNILRRGTKQGYSIVEFSTPDGARYRAKWYVRLKRTNNYSTVERTLERIAPKKHTFNERKLQPVLNEIIGLDYNQFSRTVMLAQGSFSNFIKARREDKAALLEKLTGTEVYAEISRKIHQQTQLAQQAHADLTNEVKGMLHNRLEDEELNALRETSQRLSTSLEFLDTEAGRIGRQLEWHEAFALRKAAVRRRESEEAEAHKRYTSLRGEEEKLERYDSVLCIQPVYQEISQRTADIDASRKQEHAVQKEIDANRADLRTLDSALTTAKERIDEMERRFHLRSADINRGHALNGEISQAKTQLGNWEKQLQEAQNAAARSRTIVSSRRADIASVEKDIEQQSLRKQSLIVHKRMFEKFDLVKDKLSALDTERKRTNEQTKQLATQQNRLQQLTLSIGKSEKSALENAHRLSTLKSELAIHTQANYGCESAVLQRRCTEHNHRLQALKSAALLWQRISAGYEELEERKADSNRRSADLQQMAKMLERMQNERDVLSKAFERLHVSYTLSQSQDILKLRHHLKEGTACPVCGATHHPYHTETEREMGKLLSNLEKEYKELQNELNAATEALTAERERYAALTAVYEEVQNRLAECEKRQAADVEQWAQYAELDSSFRDCSATANRHARRIMLRQLQESAVRAASEAERDWTTFNAHQEKINAINAEMARVNDKISEERSGLEKLRTDRSVAAAAIEELQRSIDRSDRARLQLHGDLSSLLTPDWASRYQENPDGYRTGLKALYQDWQTTCSKLETGQNRLILLQKDLRAAEDKLTEAEGKMTECLDRRNKTAEILSAKMQELRRLFGDGSPEQEAETHRTAMAEARAKEAEARRRKDAMLERVNQLGGTLTGLQENRSKCEELLRVKRLELDNWLLQYNVEHTPMQYSELKKIFSDPCDWNALRREVNAVRQAADLARHNLKAAQVELTELQAKPGRPNPEIAAETYEALQALSAENAAKKKLQQAEWVIVDEKLRLHENAVRNAEKMEEKIRAAYENYEEWSRLNKLFGSSDGKKFRNWAQGYTFATLVEHANQQLRQLSPRYELQATAGSLDLEIIDREMFDQRRYVHSLSGGETFVVSLALALSLASLSSNNLAIGSLFIDEGFGHLDRDSLDIVMNALANLENTQGRKVGVISHTEQIQQQISPRIHVCKRPVGGSSEIVIE